MARLMRCKYCGTLQDEPPGAKICAQCGGELVFENAVSPDNSYIKAQLELDQIAAPADRSVERHLVVTVEAPASIPRSEQAGTASGREPLHLVAVLDVSGSMRGAKIESARAAVRQVVQRLQQGDLFSLVTFDTEVRCLAEGRRIDEAFRRVAQSLVDEMEAGGQTALCGGLEQGIAQALKHAQPTNLVLLLSDGQANVGETDLEAIGRRAWEGRRQNVTVSTLGVGVDYNEALMSEIATEGGGRFYHIARPQQITAYLTGELGEVASLAARQAVIWLNLPAQAVVSSLSSAFPAQGHQVGLGDIPLSTRLEVVLRVRLPGQPAGTRLEMDGELAFQSPAGRQWRVPLNTVTLRYDPAVSFPLAAGAVRPVARRVFDQLQAAGVLAASKAATRGAAAAQQQSQAEMETMRQYASLLGDAADVVAQLAESEKLLGRMAAPAPSAETKAAYFAAYRRHHGSKDFDST